MAKGIGTRVGTSTPIRSGGPQQPRASSDKMKAAAGEKRDIAASKGEAVQRRGVAEPSGNRNK